VRPLAAPFFRPPPSEGVERENSSLPGRLPCRFSFNGQRLKQGCRSPRRRLQLLLRQQPRAACAAAFIKPAGGRGPAPRLARENLLRQSRGLTGRLAEISAWLQKDGNAWLSPDGRGSGWEEVPYCSRATPISGTFLDDEAMIREAGSWIEGAINSQRRTETSAPSASSKTDGSQDFCQHVMSFCHAVAHERTGDPRVIDLMTKYFRYQLSVPDLLSSPTTGRRCARRQPHASTGSTPHRRALAFGPPPPRSTAAPPLAPGGRCPTGTTVNMAQGFREPATFVPAKPRTRRTFGPLTTNFFLIRKTVRPGAGGMYPASCVPLSIW